MCAKDGWRQQYDLHVFTKLIAAFHSPLRSLLIFALAALLVLSTSAIVATLPGGEWADARRDVSGIAVPILVSSIAGLVTLVTAQNWRVQRRKEQEAELRQRTAAQEAELRQRTAEKESELRQRRADITAKLMASVLEKFGKGSALTIEYERAHVGIWGSRKLVEKWAEWNAFVNTLPGVPTEDGKILHTVRGHEPRAHAIVAELFAAARADLDVVDSVPEPTLGAALFDDYGQHPLVTDVPST